MNKIVIIFALLMPILGFSQVDWESPRGAIKSEEIVIEKNKQLVLPQVSRRFSAISIDALPIDTTAIAYKPKEIKIEIPKIPIKLRPRTMKSEALNKTYWGNFKVGFGSYVSPFVQADVASKRSDEYAVALHFRHFSSKKGPVDDNNSGLSNTDAYVSGKLFLNKATLGGTLGGKFDKYHLYGYDATNTVPEVDSITQKLSTYSVAINLTDNDANKGFYYQLNIGANLFNAKDLNWKEQDLWANLRSDILITEELLVKVTGDVHFASQQYNTVDNSRIFFKVKPVGIYSFNEFAFEAGVGVYGTKDSINTAFKNKIYITPHLVARYHFNSDHIISAGVTGDVTWQSARMRFDKNPYLGANTVINSEVKPIDIFITANGNLAPKIDFSVGYHANMYKVFGQYVNNITNQSTFTINYLTDNNIIHSFNGQLEFVSNKNLIFSVYGKYLLFNFKTIDNPYHTPKLNLGAKAKFELENKFSTELTLSYLDGIYALDGPTSTEIEFNSILDLNISLDYKINSTFSAFIKMNNILGNKYQYYYRYPTKGFQALAGISFTL